MVRVAIAGASTGIGRHIVDVLLASKKHECVVLSRTTNLSLSALGAKVILVNYTDQSSLITALKDIHTLISTLFVVNADTDIALVDAAEKAKVRNDSFPIVGLLTVSMLKSICTDPNWRQTNT